MNGGFKFIQKAVLIQYIVDTFKADSTVLLYMHYKLTVSMKVGSCF